MSLLLATSFSAASCGHNDDDPAPAHSIVGTGIWSDEDFSLTAKFNSIQTEQGLLQELQMA